MNPDLDHQLRAQNPHNPYAPRLVAAGKTFDVIEVSAQLGHAAMKSLRSKGVRLGPVVHDRRHGKMGFLVPVQSLSEAWLRDRRGPMRHSQGAWIPIPPTHHTDGAALVWAVAPQEGSTLTPLRSLTAAIVSAAFVAANSQAPSADSV